MEPDFISQQVVDAKRYYLNLNPAQNAEFAVVCGGLEQTDSEYCVSRESFPYFGVELVVGGSGSVELAGNSFELRPGRLFAYGPDTRHTIRSNPDDPMRKYFVDLTGSRVPDLFEAAGLGQSEVLFSSSTHELIEILEMLDRDARHEFAMSVDICQTLGELFLLKIRQTCHRNVKNLTRAFESFERIRNYIDENYVTLSTVEQVADALGYTTSYISRLFQRFAGGGAYQFLSKRKMNYAAHLLLEKNMLVRDVALALNFNDAFQFSRAFKRVYGISPSTLARTRIKRTAEENE